jgi:hypothetical protein
MFFYFQRVIKIVVEGDVNHVQQRMESLPLLYYLTKKRFMIEPVKSNLSKPISVKFFKALLKIQEKIDDLAVQFVLGQAEAEDKWDDVKEKYEDFSDEIKKASQHVKKAIDVLYVRVRKRRVTQIPLQKLWGQ